MVFKKTRPEDTRHRDALVIGSHPAVMTYLSGFFLKLLDGSLIDASTFVDEMSGGGGLARIDVADNHNVNMSLFLTHVVYLLWKDIAGFSLADINIIWALHISVQGILETNAHMIDQTGSMGAG